MGTPLALCLFDVEFCKTIKTEFPSVCKGKCQIKSKLSQIISLWQGKGLLIDC